MAKYSSPHRTSGTQLPEDKIQRSSKALHSAALRDVHAETSRVRFAGMLLTLLGFSGVAVVLTNWIGGVERTLVVLAVSLILLFAGRRLSMRVGGSAEIVARTATATAVAFLFVAAIVIAVIAALVIGFFYLLAEK